MCNQVTEEDIKLKIYEMMVKHVKHPMSRAERLRLKETLDAKKKKAEAEREGRIRRKLFREQAKLKETEDELHSYNRDGDLQGKLGRPDRSIPLSD